MKTLIKTVIAGAAGMLALGASAAFADHQDNNRSERRSDYRSDQRSDYRPDFCDIDHDHRSHASNYYDYYSPDKYFRAGAYNGSGLRISVRIGDRYDSRRNNRRYDNGYNNRRYNNGRYGNGRRGRIVNRQSFDTRFRARIILTEEVVRGRRGNRRLVCTVKARGPQANYVSKRRMHRIANRNCSPRARVRVYS